MDPNTIEIFSKGMYSSWCYFRPARVLFDCGEGCATYLGNYVFGVETVCISHSHSDHVSGIPSLIGARRSARGDKKKDLRIFHPGGRDINDVFEYTRKRNRILSYNLDSYALIPDSTAPINEKWSINAFRVDHDINSICLGYRILEKRQKLKAAYIGHNIAELLRDNPDLKNKIYDQYEANIFSYTLDSYSFDERKVEKAVHWVADCTFLSEKDRLKKDENDEEYESKTHMSIEQVARICREQEVKNVYLAHFSNRYNRNDINIAIYNSDFGATKVNIVNSNRVNTF